MHLTEFASLLSNNDTNTAKNTLSYLIGNGLNNSKWNKALAHLYKSFPTSIKESEQQKKEFFPIIVKYFYTYTLNEDNKDIFDEIKKKKIEFNKKLNLLVLKKHK